MKYSRIIFLFVTTLIIHFSSCKKPGPPRINELAIYNKTLLSGFDIGIEDSKERRNWLFDSIEFLLISYPDNLNWGVVFFITGSTNYDNVYEDFSYYKSISIELRAVSLNTPISVSLEDDNSESYSNAVIRYVPDQWQTFNLSLQNFSDINLERLRVPLKFVFQGRMANSVKLKKVVFSSSEVVDTLLYETQIMNGSSLKKGFRIDCNTSNALTNWIKEQEGYWDIQFPQNQEWATVFISSSIPRDFSMFSTLTIELKGKSGGETFGIGINDILGEDPNSISTIKWTATNEWEKIQIPLSMLMDVDLKNICIPLQLVSFLPISQTIYFKNVIYSE